MNNQENNSLDLDTLNRQLALAEAQEKETEAKLEANRKFRQQLLAEQERLLNDPKERAKMFITANEKIEAGVKEYEAKGYTCDVQRDENGLLVKISFKTSKSGSRGPRKTDSKGGSTPGMTLSQFAEIYPSLGQTFTPKELVEKLVAQFGKGVHLKYNPQPTLGKILAIGHEGIRIEKVGTKGRNIYYKKIS